MGSGGIKRNREEIDANGTRFASGEMSVIDVMSGVPHIGNKDENSRKRARTEEGEDSLCQGTDY